MPAPTDLLPHLRRARDLMDSRYAEDIDVSIIAVRQSVEVPLHSQLQR
jgi:hypothetical protein